MYFISILVLCVDAAPSYSIPKETFESFYGWWQASQEALYFG